MRWLPIASWIACSLLAAPTRAQIFQPGTQPEGQDGGIVIPLQGSQSCARCHGGYDGDDDYEPHESWRGAMMASAGRDPVFLAALAVAEADHPDAADFCLRCHSMPAWLRGRSSLPEWSEAGGPRLLPDEEGLPSSDRDGVSCVTCHRAVEPPDPALLGNARMFFLDGEDADVRTGPYAYGPGEVGPRHGWMQSAFLAEGAFCGQCHDIDNPLVDGRNADGSSTGRPFAVERTYSEWVNSAFADRGETCQDCHMPLVEGPVRAAAEGVERAYFRRHDLAGGSVWQPLAIAAAVPDAEGAVRPHLEASAERARQMLARAAHLEVTAHALEGERVSATVRVTNRTGHKLPTGYPEGRRMWLEVVVLDGAGAVVAGSGLYDGEARLQEDHQLRTYEARLGQGSEPSFHFALADRMLVDTRIPPEGFRAPPARDLAPVGRDYGDGEGGFRHWDEATYLLAACGAGPLTLRARLRYQANTREYMEFLRDTAPDSLDPDVGSWGEVAYLAWRTFGGDVPVDMNEVTVPLGPSPGPCSPPAEDAGVAGDGGPRPGDGGCGCGVPGAPAPPTPLRALLALALLALALLCRRRPSTPSP